MGNGTLIAESLQVGLRLTGVPLFLVSIDRSEAGDTSLGQPLVWTLIEFEFDDAIAPDLAQALSEVLDEQLGWYCDFRTDSETFVVFARRVFRYHRGDIDGRADAAAYARSRGVPDSQLDWPV